MMHIPTFPNNDFGITKLKQCNQICRCHEGQLARLQNTPNMQVRNAIKVSNCHGQSAAQK
jgi:hypothetical protein